MTNDARFHPLYLAAHPGVALALKTGLIEGVSFVVTGGGRDIEPGDTYIAERNSGLKLLTCRDRNDEGGWINPVEIAYPYDTHECIRIELLIDDEANS